MSTESKDYQRGYAAGFRKDAKDARILQYQQVREAMQERVFLKCLELVLEHCHGWQIAGNKINNAEGYCTLAKVFAVNAISKISQ